MTKIDYLLFRNYQERDPIFYSLTSYNFLENDDELKNGYKKFIGTVTIDGYTYDKEVGEEKIIEGIGQIRFHAYNLSSLDFNYFDQKWLDTNKHSRLRIAMEKDSAYSDVYYSIFKKAYTEIAPTIPFDDWNEMTFAITEGYLIVLDKVYIKPEYRGQGISHYIHRNLFKIIYTNFNIVSLFAVGCCEHDGDESESMLEVKKNILKDNDFIVFKHYGFTAFCKFIYNSYFMLDINS
jgi:hypothetical protein